jgi:hypothetical protein
MRVTDVHCVIYITVQVVGTVVFASAQAQAQGTSATPPPYCAVREYAK